MIKMWLSKLIVIILVTLIFVISNVYYASYGVERGEAYAYDDYASIEFKPYTGYYTVCEQDRAIIPVVVRNSASQKNTYSIDFDGEKWGKTPSKISVNGNSNNMFFVSMFPPERSANTYVFRLEVINEREKNKIVKEVPVLVKDCYSLEAKAVDDEWRACNCMDFSGRVNITNRGSSDVRINVTAYGALWLDNPARAFSISPDESRIFVIGGEAPCNTTLDYGLSVRAAIPKTAYEIGFEKTVDVLDDSECGLASISEKSVYDFSDDSPEFNFTLGNSGVVDARYSVESNVPWLAFSPDNVFLSSGEEAVIRAWKSGDDVLASEEIVRITAKSGNYSYSKDFVLDVKGDRLFTGKSVGVVKDIADYLEGFFYVYRYYFFAGIVFGVAALGVIFYFAKQNSKKKKKSS